MAGDRPSFREAFRSLKAAPLVLGVLALVSGVGIVVGLAAGSTVQPRAALVGLAVWTVLLGSVLIVLYYRLRAP
jgi:hypothetical protein